MLRVQLGGGLRAEVDGAEIPLPASRRARSLLAWLALHPGMHPRAELAARFWPDVLDESARTSLRAALAELRRALGDGAQDLVATRDAIGLGDAVAVDERELAALLDAGRVAEAVDGWEGELLAGMDDDWVHEAREARRARLAEALEQLAAAAEQAGDLQEAARRSRQAAALDPLGEEAARRLMRRLAAAGDRAAALAAHDRLATRLRDELGIAPSAETRALVAEIRGAEAPRAAVPVARVVEEDTPFVGREAELGRLRAALESATARRARRLVLVAGEPGVGKTRLSLHFGREAHDTGAVVLRGRCSEEPLGPYEPFAEILQAVGADVLARDDGGDAGARARLFDAVDAALTGLAGGRPLVLLLDDLHWADRPTVLLLAALLRSPRDGPLLAVATQRDTPLLADLHREPGTERLPLAGLAPGDVADLAASWLGAGAPDVAAAVHRRTGGNAFFVQEVLRDLAEHDAQTVPVTVREAIGGRLAALGDDAREMVEVAAVLGLDSEPAVLDAVAGLPPARADSALDELVAAHLLRPAGARLEFPHALVREAVDAALNPLRRGRLHRRAADVLIGLSEERHLEQIAHHLSAAPDPERAVEYLARAGRRALTMLAYEEAARLFGRALEVLEEHGAPGDERAGALHVARGDALLRGGAPAEARSSFAAAAALARRTGDAALLARAALGLTGLGVAIIDVDREIVDVLEEALAAVGEEHPVLATRLLARLAVELYYTPARDRSDALSAEAVAVARSAGDPRALAAALNARHVALWRPDRAEERLALAGEMIDAARAAGERDVELQARNWRVADLFELGDLEGWRAEVRRHDALAQELRLAQYAWYAPLWAAVDAQHAGRHEEARELARVAREAGEQAGDANALLFEQMLHAHEHVMRGQVEKVDLALFEEKIAGSPASASWRCGYAWILAALGRRDEARAHLEALAAGGYATVPFDANWPSAMAECAEACVLLGHTAAAAPLAEILAPYAGRPLTAGRAISSYGAADRHLGGLALVLGRPHDAVAHLRRGIELDAAAGMRPWVVRGRAWLARALALVGDADAARAEQDAAEAEARAIGVELR